ncbi:MAG: rhodanese-like domain-containing protein [Chitinophagales bacterium]
MIEFFKNLLGVGSKLNIEELLAKGAVIVDVRTEREFKGGHIRGSVNIPLDKLPKNISKLKKNKPVITCCASGMRSSTAKNILISNGFPEVYNGGSWISVQHKLK